MSFLAALVVAAPLCVVSGCGSDAGGEDGKPTDAGGTPTDAAAEADSAQIWFDSGQTDSDAAPMPCGGEVQSGCTWSVPLAPNGQPADPNVISVRLRDSSGKETLLVHVEDAGACAAATLGWYTVLNEGGSGAQLVACPYTCDFIASSAQQVVVVPGCVDPQS